METDSSFGALVLPAYSPATRSPGYSREPRPDEERLQISERVPGVRELTGVFIEKTKHVTLALTNQIPNCKEPTYGKGGVVQGAVSPTRAEGITMVQVKLEAVLITSMTSVSVAGDTEVPLFSKQEVLFGPPPKHKLSSFSRIGGVSHTQNTDSSADERCPSTLVFAINIPKMYLHEGVSRMLPPSYFHKFNGIPGLRLESRYTLYIIICRKSSLGRDKKIVVTQPLNFAPRSRPAQPALPTSLSFLSTLKSSPEEWKLFEAETEVRDGHEGIPTISSALLLPRSQVYPLSQSIPFHLQLSCASGLDLAQYAPRHSQTSRPSAALSRLSFPIPSSMNALPLRLSQNPNSRSSSHKETSDFNPSTIDTEDKRSGRIYISVQRHVTVAFMGTWMQLKKSLSTSTFKRCPNLPRAAGNVCVAWEGHINVLEESKCGGFEGPGVQVKDYILLSVIPPDSDHAPLQEIRQLIPIRLTTDPYFEDIIMADVELARNAT